MKVSTFLAIAGALGVVFGLAFLLAPGFALPQYGVPTEPHHLMLARYFGATLVAFGLVLWLLRRTRDDDALRAILLADVVGNAIGTALSAWSTVVGLQNAMGWSSAAIYGALTLGGIYFLSARTRRGQ